MGNAELVEARGWGSLLQIPVLPVAPWGRRVAKRPALVLAMATLHAGSPGQADPRHGQHEAQPGWLWLLLGCSFMLSELLCKLEDFFACSTMLQYQRKMRKPG